MSGYTMERSGDGGEYDGDEDELLEAQEGKGYGADEGEREEALEAEEE